MKHDVYAWITSSFMSPRTADREVGGESRPGGKQELVMSGLTCHGNGLGLHQVEDEEDLSRK